MKTSKRNEYLPGTAAAYLAASGARWHQLQQEVLGLISWRFHASDPTRIEAQATNGRWTSLSRACQSWARRANA